MWSGSRLLARKTLQECRTNFSPYEQPTSLLRSSHGNATRPRRLLTGSQSEIALMPYAGGQSLEIARSLFWHGAARYRELNKSLPFTMAFLLYSSKAAGCDIFAQKVIEKRKQLEARRMIAAALFGGVYAGCVQHFIFNRVFTVLFGSAGSIATGAKKTMADALVQTPLMWLPTFLAFDEVLCHGSIVGLKDRWCREVGPTMKLYAMMWPAVHLYNFAFVPVELRMTVIAAASLVWLTGTSILTHSRH
eukprot:TRINITY_DN35604_c0_g1_i2.p1 TRINITY_DN35604_c0_g1~~TRINITY_DN35604_c0_g1_i2.p1  ORF type:complete len:248 (+),score=38.71 TRINITY_DN35604_c0_g1_i2:48-791(+)